ncbi:MAG TPA: hypothetical protein VGC52_14500 [Gemmatimonadaceae bacterium]
MTEEPARRFIRKAYDTGSIDYDYGVSVPLDDIAESRFGFF